MAIRLTNSQIETIERLIKEGKTAKYIKNKCNVSLATIRRISTQNYPTYYREFSGIKNINITISKENIVANFIALRKHLIKELHVLINYKNTIIINTDCYSNKFKQYRVKFLFRNNEVYFFKNLNNNMIMCFKFGDFLAKNIKVVLYE